MEVLSSEIIDAVNTQIGRELFNANQYLAIAAYFRDQALDNIAAAYQKEAEGEREHAQKFIDFLVDLRGKVNIPILDAPVNYFASSVDAARAALALELQTTEYIYNLVSLAQSQDNHIFYNFLLWFVGEQQEEISTANDRIDILSRNSSTLELANIIFGE
jgi:ferritin